MTKTCTQCNQTKATSEFYKFCHSPDGLQPECKECRKNRVRVYQRTPIGWKKNMLRSARSRAARDNRMFTITDKDFDIPEVCPVLGIPLIVSDGKGQKPESATLDRIDSTKGYIPGNVQVMSNLANSMKQNANPEQLLAFANWVQRTYGGM